MGWQKGNTLWERRSKHGRPKLFETPALMWEAACEYFEWCEQNPWEKMEWKNDGGALKQVTTTLGRPFTLSGLCLYLDCAESYFRNFRMNLVDNDPLDFSTVIDKITQTIYAQKFEGASVGVFNANIIARDLNLKEHTETTGKDGAPLIPEALILKMPPGMDINLPSNTDGEE